MTIKYWDLPEMAKDTDENSLLDMVVKARGINLSDLSENKYLCDYPALKDIDKAVERIRRALRDGEKIAVYGDYDCDGITSTAMLYSYLETEGADVSFYIPDRHTEGYGMNTGAVHSLSLDEITLIITVDNGISAIEEIAYANMLGIDIIVTDHHRPTDTLPEAVAVINPHRTDCPSKLTQLCGAGVVYALICALEDGDEETVLEQYADLAAIGTIGDVVELAGVNKMLVQRGVQNMSHTPRVGIAALLDCLKIDHENLTSSHVAYNIVPRLNAAGRLGDVSTSLLLLLTEDNEQAFSVAIELDNYNKRRRELEALIDEDLSKILADNPEMLNKRIIVLKGEDWHHGVLGIVAARVSEKHSKPAILFSLDGGFYRASGRSIEGFDLIDAVSECGDILHKYGGHPMAVGLTVSCDNIDEFTKRINAYANEHYRVMPLPKIKIDAAVPPSNLNVENVEALSELSPFGAGNPVPIFMIKRARLKSIHPLSAGKHLRLVFSGGGIDYSVLYFGMSDENFLYKSGAELDVVFTADINVYNNRKSVALKAIDMRPSFINQDEICKDNALYTRYLMNENISEHKASITPTREDGAEVYRKIKELKTYAHGTQGLYLTSEFSMGYCKYMITVEVLKELGFISVGEKIQLLPIKDKRDFYSAQCIKRLL